MDRFSGIPISSPRPTLCGLPGASLGLALVAAAGVTTSPSHSGSGPKVPLHAGHRRTRPRARISAASCGLSRTKALASSCSRWSRARSPPRPPRQLHMRQSARRERQRIEARREAKACRLRPSARSAAEKAARAKRRGKRGGTSPRSGRRAREQRHRQEGGGGGLLGSGREARSGRALEARSRQARPQPQRLPGCAKSHTLPPLPPGLSPKKPPPPSPRLKRRLAHLHPRDRRRRRVLAPNPTARHRSAPRGARRFADRNDKSTQPMPETGAQPPPDPDPKRARRSSNRRSRRPSSRPRKPKGNGHSNVEGAQSLASRFWAKAEEIPNTPWKLVADRLHANLAICQDAYRLRKLPPSILPEQAESFAA